MVWPFIVLVIVLIAIGICIYYINKIIVLSNRIDNAWSQIDVQLKKRADLVPNLVETVKGYMKHEKNAIRMVTKARENMMKASDIKARVKAEGELTRALKTIFAIAENYPNLKASENFKLLQEQLEGIESKVAYSRQFYNDCVLNFNNTVTTIPGRWFAGVVGKTKTREFFEIPEIERRPVKVEF
ncbi:MAG: LemA family protein [Candidatus Aenigmarchaeota archaeon]|nr:LemA family protein [Candidatus Aenigmarchaeota archaeon]